MFTPRITIACLFVFCITGCKSNHESHNTGIGRGYSFTSFNFTSSTGASFPLSAGEMRALEKVWSVPITSGADTIENMNTLISSSPTLTYSFVLDDGYTATLGAYIGTVSGADFLSLELEGDGGGFMGDVSSKLVPLASIFSAARRSDLSATLGVLAAPLDPGKKEGEQAVPPNGP